VDAVTGSGQEDLDRLAARVRALEAAVDESRRLSQRLCDVVELVTDVLVPASDLGDPRLSEALAHLERVLREPGQRSL
jgi:hypothetical protein